MPPDGPVERDVDAGDAGGTEEATDAGAANDAGPNSDAGGSYGADAGPAPCTGTRADFEFQPHRNAACTSASTAFCAAAVFPSELPLSGGNAFLVTFGPMPAHASITVDGASVGALDAAGRFPLPAKTLVGAVTVPIDVAVVDDASGVVLATIPDAAAWIHRPVLPTLRASANDLGALAPEFAGPCARSALLTVGNDGDDEYAIGSVTVTDDNDFTVTHDGCTGTSLASGGQCEATVCFSGIGDATGRFTTEAHLNDDVCDLQTSIAVDLLGPAKQLDATFGIVHASGTPVAYLDGIALVATDAPLITTISSSGALAFVANASTIRPRFIRSSPSLDSIYLAGDDPSVACCGLALLAPPNLALAWQFVTNAVFGAYGLEVTSQDDVLVVGDHLQAFDDAGAIDPSWGTSGGGASPLETPSGDCYRAAGVSALDANDRLYVVLQDFCTFAGDRITRYDASGSFDASFDTGVLPGEFFSLAPTPSGLWVAIIGRTPSGLVDRAELLELDDAGAVVASTAVLNQFPDLLAFAGVVVAADGTVLVGSTVGLLHFGSDASFHGVIGVAEGAGSASPVRCPATGGIGGCFVVGTAGEVGYVARLADP